jgi:Ferredoxin-fold anticodon binding domain
VVVEQVYRDRQVQQQPAVLHHGHDAMRWHWPSSPTRSVGRPSRRPREADELIRAVSYVIEYRGSWVPDGRRSLTLRVTLRPRDTTLTADVIGAVRSAVLEVLDRKLKAYLR